MKISGCIVTMIMIRLVFQEIVASPSRLVIDGSPCQTNASHLILKRGQVLQCTVLKGALLKRLLTPQLTVLTQHTLVALQTKKRELFLNVGEVVMSTNV